MTELPFEFKERMREQLGDGYEDFIRSYERERVRALRVNTLKMSAEDFERAADFPIRKIPFIKGGYYFECDGIGNHPLHHAGAIYVQEPSAMAVMASLDIPEGFRVLDACAAPGGKSTHAAQYCTDGLVVSNEYVFSRAKILMQNIERLGVKNSIVTSTDTETLAKRYPECFDLVIADAPCSGEGMMRKNELAVSEWSVGNVMMCAERQRKILSECARCVAPLGYLLYSTCTFSLEENEMQVDAFLAEHTDFHLVPVREEIRAVSADGMEYGGHTAEGLALTRRFYPHLFEGEGQYIALMRRTGERALYDSALGKINEKKKKREKEKPKGRSSAVKSDAELARAFVAECIGAGNLDVEMREDGVYIPADKNLGTEGCFSCGVKVGTVQKGRVVPSHRFFMAYGDMFKNKMALTKEQALRYIGGETLECDAFTGYGVVTYCGATLGGIKVSDKIAKNYYPKGIRS